MKDSPLLCALDAYDKKDKDSIAKSQSLPSPKRQSSSLSLGRARMNAANLAVGVADCDVEIIGEKVAKSSLKDDNVMQEDKAASPKYRALAKTPRLSNPQAVVRLQNECGIGSQLITYIPPGMPSGQAASSSTSVTVGTLGHLITSNGKVEVTFNGATWVQLGKHPSGKVDDKADTSPSGKPFGQASADCSDPNSKPEPADLQTKRQWKHADPSIFDEGTPVKRPALDAHRSHERSPNGQVTARPALEAHRSLDRSPFACRNKAAAETAAQGSPVRKEAARSSTQAGRSPLSVVAITAGAATGSHGSGAVSPTAFYGSGGSSSELGSCSVRSPYVISPGRLSALSCTTPRGAASAAGGTASLLRGGGGSGSKLVQTGLPVARASSDAAVEATCWSSKVTAASKPQATAGPRKGRPRRHAATAAVIETVVLSSDEDGDGGSPEPSSGPSKKCRTAVEVGSGKKEQQQNGCVAEDDLFPSIPPAYPVPGSSSAAGLSREYSRRLVTQTSRSAVAQSTGSVDTRSPRSAAGRRRSTGDCSSELGSVDGNALALHALHVRLGTHVCKACEAVTLSVDKGIRLELEGDPRNRVVVRIDCRDMTACVGHFSKKLAVLVLSTTPALGIKLRQAFAMVDPSVAFFDPHGKDEAHRNIVIVFDCIQISSPLDMQRKVQELFRDICLRHKPGGQMQYKHVPLLEASQKLLALGISTWSSPAATIAALCSAATTTAPSACTQVAEKAPSAMAPSLPSQNSQQPSSTSGSSSTSGGTRPGKSSGRASNSCPAAVAAARLHDIDRWSSSSSSPPASPRASFVDERGDVTVAQRCCAARRQSSDGDEDCATATSEAIDEGDSGADAAAALPCSIEDAEDEDSSSGRVEDSSSPRLDSEGSSDKTSPESAPMVRRSRRHNYAHSSLAGSAKQLFLYPYPRAVGSIAVTSDDVSCLEEGEFLNDVIVDFYLKFLAEERLSAESRRRTHIFSSFFYVRLTQNPSSSLGRRSEEHLLSMKERRHSRVKTWTRHVDIFEKDFLIVPINENSHWYLAVICFPSSLPAMYSKAVCAKRPPSGQQCRDEPQPEIVRKARSLKGKRIEDDDGDTAHVGVHLTAGTGHQPADCEPGSSHSSHHSTFASGCNDDKEQPAKAVKVAEGISANNDEASDNSVAAKYCRPPAQSTASGRPKYCSPEPSVVALQLPPPRPCILIFDSLGSSPRSSATRMLREYLEVEWCTRKGPVDPAVPVRELFSKEKIPGQCPRCPQQDNYCDCGLYLLQYVESFFENPIKDYAVPIPPVSDWFSIDRVKCKRKELKALLRSIQSEYDKT